MATAVCGHYLETRNGLFPTAFLAHQFKVELLQYLQSQQQSIISSCLTNQSTEQVPCTNQLQSQPSVLLYNRFPMAPVKLHQYSGQMLPPDPQTFMVQQCHLSCEPTIMEHSLNVGTKKEKEIKAIKDGTSSVVSKGNISEVGKISSVSESEQTNLTSSKRFVNPNSSVSKHNLLDLTPENSKIFNKNIGIDIPKQCSLWRPF